MADKRTDVFREHPIFLTSRAALALGARCRKALRERGVHDVSTAQLAVLAALDEDEGQTPTGLAQLTRYEKSSLTPMINKLELAGLLLRSKDPKDGRVQHLYLTKKGRKRRKEVEQILDAVTRELLDTLPRKTLKHHVAFCEAVLEGEVSGATLDD